MGILLKHKEIEFSVGDTVRVITKVQEKDKTKTSSFEGVVIAVKNEGMGKSFTVRRIGEAQIGIERIFPLFGEVISEIKVLKSAKGAIRRAKLYFLRKKPRSYISEIYKRSAKR